MTFYNSYGSFVPYLIVEFLKNVLNPVQYTCFSAVIGGGGGGGGLRHRKMDELSICPTNIIFDLFRLLVISYSWFIGSQNQSEHICAT